MVSLLSALQRAENTVKYTIDDADYIINWVIFIIINQLVMNFRHSHSVEPCLFLVALQHTL